MHFEASADAAKIKESSFKPDHEPTRLYRLGSQGKHHVLVSMRDTSESNNFTPVIQSLLDSGNFGVSVFADGPGSKTLEENFNVRQENVQDILVSLAEGMSTSEVVLVSQSSDSGINMALTADAKINNIPIVAVEDYPGVLADQHKLTEEAGNALLYADYFCVMNSWSRENLIKNRPGVDPKKVIITGIPSFCEVNTENKIKSRRRFREKHDIDDNIKLVVWVGQLGEGDSDSFLLFLKGLREAKIGDYKLAVRRHPRDTRNGEFFDNAQRGFDMLDTSHDSIDDVRRSGDLVATMLSTEGVKAVCEGTMTMLVLVPEMLKKSGYENAGVPIAEDGSSIVIKDNNSANIAKAIEQVFSDDKTKKELEENMKRWKADQNAPQNVVGVITNVVGL